MMHRSKLMLLASFIGVALLAGGCKKVNDTSSSAGSKTGYGKCGCSDIECWDSSTKALVSENIQCAKTAGKGALGLYAVKLLKFLEGSAEVVNAIDDEGFKGLAQEVLSDVAGTKLGDRYKKVQCLKSSRSSLKGFMNFFSSLEGISRDGSVGVVISILKTSLNSVTSAINFVGNVKVCFNGNDPEDKAFKKITSGITKIMQGVAIFTTLKDCGFAISEGGALIYNNTQCLLRDLDKLALAESKLASMHKKNAYKPSPNNTNSSLCNDESTNCNTFAMGKYGSYLYNQSYFGYRSYDCAELCSNNSGSRKRYCEEADEYDGIFKNAPNCRKTCGTKQCQNAVNVCVSNCCRQNGTCVDDAHDYIKRYNW